MQPRPSYVCTSMFEASPVKIQFFTPCRLHPASNQNSISESHPEYEGHAHHYVITITSSRGPNGGSSALPRPSSYTAAPRRTAPGPSNLCPSYLTTLDIFFKFEAKGIYECPPQKTVGGKHSYIPFASNLL